MHSDGGLNLIQRLIPRPVIWSGDKQQSFVGMVLDLGLSPRPMQAFHEMRFVILHCVGSFAYTACQQLSIYVIFLFVCSSS